MSAPNKGEIPTTARREIYINGRAAQARIIANQYAVIQTRAPTERSDAKLILGDVGTQSHRRVHQRKGTAQS